MAWFDAVDAGMITRGTGYSWNYSRWTRVLVHGVRDLRQLWIMSVLF